jgi:cell division protein FtsI/penicillin-binding protein 2
MRGPRQRWWLPLLLVACCASLSVGQAPLNHRSSALLLERRFPQKEIEYILLDARSGDVLSSRWTGADDPAPLGSLVKPFTALAYGEEHHFLYPEYECHGKRDRCWLPRGHGHLGLVQAVAQSCNAYFLSLASDLKASSVAAVLRRYSVYDVGEKVPTESLVGLGSAWKISPLRMLRAYTELVRRRDQPGVAELIQGMLISESSGTGAGVGSALRKSGASALTKTGTAPCVHGTNGDTAESEEHPKSFAGDGYVVALYPAVDSQIALMVRLHSAPGSKAAEVAGKMLRTIADGK